MAITKFDTRVFTDEINLHQADVWHAEGDLRGEQITCTAGQIWVTQKNDLSDHVLKPGEVFWVTQPGTVVVQAIKAGQFRFSRISSHQQPNRN